MTMTTAVTVTATAVSEVKLSRHLTCFKVKIDTKEGRTPLLSVHLYSLTPLNIPATHDKQAIHHVQNSVSAVYLLIKET